MAYSTNSDLIASVDELQVVQLVDDAGTGFSTIAQIEAAAADGQNPQQAEAQAMLDRIERASVDADELINTFLRTQYQVPIDPVPAMIRSLAVDLRIHNLYQRRMRDDMPENILALEKRALTKLEKMQKGVIKIQDKPDIAAGQIVTNKTKSDKMFPDDLLDRF